MTVLVTGATGSVGREVLRRLLDLGAPVRASTRDPASAVLPPGVDVRAVDLAEPSTLAAALDGIDAVYIFPSFDDPGGVAAALIGSAVQRLVLLSSISASLPDAEEQFNARRFLDLERALAATGIPCTFLRTGEFAGNIRFYAPGIASGAVEVPHPESNHLPVDERDVAEAAVVGLISDALEGQRPVLTGAETLTLRQEIEAIARAIGRPVEITEMPEERALQTFAPAAPRLLVDVAPFRSNGRDNLCFDRRPRD